MASEIVIVNSDDSTINGDHNIDEEQIQQQEDQQQYFNIPPIYEVGEEEDKMGMKEWGLKKKNQIEEDKSEIRSSHSEEEEEETDI